MCLYNLFFIYIIIRNMTNDFMIQMNDDIANKKTQSTMEYAKFLVYFHNFYFDIFPVILLKEY